MAYPNFQAGMRITAAMLRDLQIKSVKNGNTQTVTNSTSLVDTSLIVAVEAGAQYKFRLMVSYTASTAGDIQFAWSTPSGGAMRRFTWALGPGGTGGAGDFTSISMRQPAPGDPVSAGGGGTTRSYHEEGLMIGGDADGAFTFRFAQNTADDSDATMNDRSRVEYIRLE